LIFACAKWDQTANRLASDPRGAVLALALPGSRSCSPSLQAARREIGPAGKCPSLGNVKKKEENGLLA